MVLIIFPLLRTPKMDTGKNAATSNAATSMQKVLVLSHCAVFLWRFNYLPDETMTLEQLRGVIYKVTYEEGHIPKGWTQDEFLTYLHEMVQMCELSVKMCER